MTTRRELIKGAAAAGLVSMLPALPADAAEKVEVHPEDVSGTKTWLSGMITLYDPVGRTFLQGDIAFVSDGVSRSEIILTNSDSRDEHRIRFTGTTNWQIGGALMDAMQGTYKAVPVGGPANGPTGFACTACLDLGTVERGGDWIDCPECMP